MRLLKPVLTAVLAILAVIAGLFATVLVAVTGAGVLLVRRLLRFRRGSAAAAQARTRLSRQPADEPIEVVATEVPADPRGRS